MRRLADEHLEQRAAKTIDVRATVDRRLGHRLLGTHVGERAHRDAGLRQSLVRTKLGERARDPEVRHHRSPGGEQDVLRLDVPMDDAALMRVHERDRDIVRDLDRIVHRQLAFPVEPRAQRFALDARHDEVGDALNLAGVEQWHDVRMIELRLERDLSHEPFDSEPADEFRVEHLDRDEAIEAEVARAVDDGRRAAPQFALEGVPIPEMRR